MAFRRDLGPRFIQIKDKDGNARELKAQTFLQEKIQQQPQQAKQMTQAPERRVIPHRRRISSPAVHSMSRSLGIEQQLANNPMLREAMLQRYGGNDFSNKNLIEFAGSGADLQRAGVDFIAPDGRKIDLKMRSPELTYDDLLTEIVSVDKTLQLGRQIKPTSAKQLLEYLSKVSMPNKLGWTIDPTKQTDEIVYSVPGRKEISFINASALRAAMPELLDRQFARGRPFYSVAPNTGYNTVNMPISNRIVRDVLKSDIETIRF
jgi:hypothetical protein